MTYGRRAVNQERVVAPIPIRIKRKSWIHQQSHFRRKIAKIGP